MYNIYVVSPGDTIESIAARYNTTPQELYRINSFLNQNEPLTIGQRIIIPVPKTDNFEYYTIRRGDTLYNISRKYDLTSEQLAMLNGLDASDYLYPGQILLVPKSGIKVTITKDGDTLASLSRQLNSNLEQILLQNPDIYLLPEQLIVYRKTST